MVFNKTESFVDGFVRVCNLGGVMRSSPIFLPVVAGVFLVAVGDRVRGDIHVELVEVGPAAEDAVAAGFRTLSQRFFEMGRGRHYVRLSREKTFNGADQVVLYTDPVLLSETGPEETNVVVDLRKRRAYLLVGDRMALETEVAVNQFGQETPAGFFQMSERVKNGAISERVRTPVPYWIQLGNSETGLHGGHLYGYTAAGSCVRLPIPAAEIVFAKTQEGTPVAIYESWSLESSLAAAEPSGAPASSRAPDSPAVEEPSAPASKPAPMTPPVRIIPTSAAAQESKPEQQEEVRSKPEPGASPAEKPAVETEPNPVRRAQPPKHSTTRVPRPSPFKAEAPPESGTAGSKAAGGPPEHSARFRDLFAPRQAPGDAGSEDRHRQRREEARRKMRRIAPEESRERPSSSPSQIGTAADAPPDVARFRDLFQRNGRE